jgi:hypothetical protein
MSGLRVNADREKLTAIASRMSRPHLRAARGPSEKAALSICASIYDHWSAAIGEPIALRS